MEGLTLIVKCFDLVHIPQTRNNVLVFEIGEGLGMPLTKGCS